VPKKNKTEKLNLYQVIAMGVGGMVGGGIFSVLGLAIVQAGHAAPIAFLLGGIIALLTGLSYAKLGLTYQSDGGSFTFLEKAFATPFVAGLGGWLLLLGYVGTMALYAYTFAVYGSAMLGSAHDNMAMQHLLQSLVLLSFLGVNLYGVKASGNSELVIVTIKVLILALFSVIGLFYVQPDHLLPVFNQGHSGVLMAAALTFVAYEGFELIPNSVNEMKDPDKNLPRGIIISIVITLTIYLLVSLVAVGNLLPKEVIQYKEYALAVAAKPFLGEAGFILIGTAALFSSASAINATLFGTARLGMVMAKEKALPAAFAFTRQQNNIPWLSLIIITVITLVFVNLSNLDIISSFASSTFLLIFSSINLSALRLRRVIHIHAAIPMSGMLLSFISWIVLMGYLWQTSQQSLLWIGIFYSTIIIAETLFSQRRCIFKST